MTQQHQSASAGADDPYAGTSESAAVSHAAESAAVSNAAESAAEPVR